jgi:hypothetical protein
MRVEPHRVHTREHEFAEGAAERVEKLVERVAGARLRSLGPEEQEQLIPAPTAFTRGGKHGEERQPAAVVSVRAKDGVVAGANEGECAEGR